MKSVTRLILKAQNKRSKGRTLRHIYVYEEPGGYMIQPYYNDHGKITTEGIMRASKEDARLELERLERELPKGPNYHVMNITDEMVLYLKAEMEAGKTDDQITFPDAMLRRAERMLGPRKKHCR